MMIDRAAFLDQIEFANVIVVSKVAVLKEHGPEEGERRGAQLRSS